jgi:hypothetical protein|tara:strand:+ start:259 stop:630 length:372 start_codon:yes stop_codon:yes gene_type:complete
VSFGSDLRAITDARKLDLNKASRGVTLRVFDAVLRDTRVDKGRLRGNWNVAVDAVDYSTSEELDNRPGAALASGERAKVEAFKLNVLSNSLPYAAIWETRDGMVAKAVADITRLLRAEVEALK